MKTNQESLPESPNRLTTLDMAYLQDHGHMSVIDAQNLHISLMSAAGINEPDLVVEDWNHRDPDAPWGSGKVGKYVHYLSELAAKVILEQCALKIRECEG